MRTLLMLVLSGALVMVAGCKCGKDSDDGAPGESLEMAPDAQHSVEEGSGEDQMGQDMPPVEDPIEEGYHPDTMDETMPEQMDESMPESGTTEGSESPE